MEHFEASFATWVINKRWMIVPLSLLLVLLAASGMRHLYFTNEYRIFFSEDNPQLLAFDALEDAYSKNDNVLILVDPVNKNVFSRETLSIIEELTEKSWQIPYSNRVDSITNFQYTEAQEDDLVVRDLVSNAINLTDAELVKIRDIAVSEPLLSGLLIPDKGHVTAVNVTVQVPQGDDITPEIVAFVRNLADEFRLKYPGTEIYLSGIVMVNNAFQELSQNDMANLVPVSFAIMFVLMYLLVGGLIGTLCIVLVIGLSITSALGVGGHIGFAISSVSVSAPTIILTVAVANCVHILITYLYCMQHGYNKDDAVRESLRVNLFPVSLASMTTTLGFLTMNMSDVPPFRDLGNYVAFGVITAYLLSITLLPALLSILPVRVKQMADGETSAISRFADFIIRNRTSVFWVMLVLIILALSGLPRNELNDTFIHYFDHRTDIRKAADFTTENLTGVYNIEYSLDSGEPGGIGNPLFLHDVEAFTDWYRQQPEVIHVNSITDIFKRLNKNMHADNEDMYRLPEDRELAAQYLLLYEMSLPYGLDLNNQINIDKSATRFTITLKTISSNELIALDLRAQEWLRDNTQNILPSEGTSADVMFSHIGKRNIVSMLWGTTIALLLISLVLILAFRSILVGVISLVPNLVPAGMGFGIWGYLVGEVGLALSIVSTMTLGIIVDDTVHFLSKYLRARREKNLAADEAVRYAFKTVGRALIITSIILITGFLVLTTSSFKLNSGMGALTAIVIALALLADFLFLPTVLMKSKENSNV